MKNLYVLLCCILPILSSAQDFAPLGAKWYYQEGPANTPTWEPQTLVLTSSKDTLVLGENSRKIDRVFYSYDGLADTLDPYLIYQEADTVYLYDPINIEWDKLYIFNVSEGDTITLDVPFDAIFNPENETTFRLRIDFVEIDEIGSIQLKKYKITPLDGFTWINGWYMDKAGGFDWFTSRYKGFLPEDPGPLICYHEGDLIINPYNYNCEDVILGIKGGGVLRDLTIYPNPASDQITVDSQIEIEKIEVFSLHGNLLKSSLSNQIDVSNLKDGVYFLKIYSGGDFAMKKIIKE